jgi:hypothetical protein
VHRLTDVIENALEKKKVCATIFLDVKQTSDKIRHKGLITKLHKLLPKQFVKYKSPTFKAGYLE